MTHTKADSARATARAAVPDGAIPPKEALVSPGMAWTNDAQGTETYVTLTSQSPSPLGPGHGNTIMNFATPAGVAHEANHSRAKENHSPE
jgi:hypothetical protein